MGCAGVVLFKHQVVTGLDVEIFHWIYVWGPCCSLLLLLVIVSLLQRLGNKARLAVSCFMVLCLTDLFAGLTLRAVEAVRARAGLYEVESYHNYRV